ncbi:MAG: type II secretion system protein [Candidatus Staskawiczbacteria bacterium]|nr:type II secretion system protein [Candidatus Staskawiczbacteria bacterium]MBI3337168.1 type II secretion system protein [Candidatus Staskawiczbacteria bacterium]
MEYKKIKTKKNRLLTGFTLIELLVVIAIIGILASILLVNLAATRNKAKDGAIKLEMAQIRAAVENFSLSNSTYVGSCAAGTDCATLKADISSKGGGSLVENFAIGAYCVQYALNAPGGGSWCVDSTGYSGPTATCDAVANNFDCDATDV